MKVFDPQLIECMHSRYDSRPEYQRPRLYWVATRPEAAGLRDQIEEWVGALDCSGRDAISTRLQNPDTFPSAYSELWVGRVLLDCGHAPIYDRHYHGKTPDWTVLDATAKVAFLVEVFTVEAPKGIQDEEKLWDELRWKLRSLEHYHHVMISAPGVSLAGRDIRQIVRHVDEWLDTISADETGEKSTTYEDEGLRLTFALIPRKTHHRAPVLSCGPVTTFFVDSHRLKRRIRKKLSRYRFAKDDSVPLVAAVLPEFASALGADNLVDVLFGCERYSITLENGVPVETQSNRRDDGLLSPTWRNGELEVSNTTLSAVLWIEPWCNPAAQVIHNPYAVNPLPLDALGGLPNLVVQQCDGRSVLAPIG